MGFWARPKGGAQPPSNLKRGMLDVRVLDFDDDGEQRAEYANFAAFVDALLGP